MKPLKTLVLVKPFEPDTNTSAGIILLKDFQERKNVGEIISVGDGTKKEPMRFKEGQIVYSVKDCGEKVTIDGVDHFLIQQRDILAIA